MLPCNGSMTGVCRLEFGSMSYMEVVGDAKSIVGRLNGMRGRRFAAFKTPQGDARYLNTDHIREVSD